MEEAQRDGGDGERQRDAEGREADAVDGVTAAPADANLNHRGSVDKSKSNTLGYQRRTKQKVVTDFATLSKGASAGAKPRAALRQVLFSQGASDKNPAFEERGQLDVLKQDLEAFAVPTILTWQWGDDGQGTTLEKSWTEIVHSHSTMSKMQRHQQEALWEFVHTELTYINQLVIIRDLVIAALENLHQHGFLLEVTAELLFSNLPSIIDAHQLFWREVIFPMLHEVRKTGKPFDPAKLAPGCMQFQERFSSYKHYCWEEEDNLEFARRHMESNPQFLTYIQWVETHPQCKRMRLGDMQAKPHQRITKYPLLLKAVLKTTQDHHVQHTIRGMLSSVNSFLESINDYLRLKDEELALSISAARVEGYVMEGINEEIDKYVREICQFDLTCPVRGVGPGVVRKLLLEENLKVRGRKDNKLEVVALLFSDVLLMTKVQKKGERLKVVRSPLALDRTYCLALKDNNAFVLVEVGELRCTMNVYIFAASTPESCATWVSTIRQAKETLWNLRETEKKRERETWKFQKPEDNNDRIEEIRTLKPPVSRDGESGEEICVDEPTGEVITWSRNEISAPKQVVKHGDGIRESASAFWQSRLGKTQEIQLRKNVADRQQAVEAMEGMEGEHGGTHTAEDGRIPPSVLTKALTWNHRAKPAQTLNETFASVSAADPLRRRTAGPHPLLVGGYPAVDYPVGDSNSLPSRHQTTSTRTDHISQSDQNAGKNFSLPRDAPIDAEKLKSPGLQRRRPVSTQQGPLAQMPTYSSQWSLHPRPGSNNSSHSDSDCNPKVKRNSLPAGQSSDSHRVLKLGALKPNQGMFWNMNDARVSPDPQTLSEPELPDPNAHKKRPKIKTQRSASIPNIVIQEENKRYPFASNSHMFHQAEGASSPRAALRRNGHPSPLEGLLERAKGRTREHHVWKTNRGTKMVNVKPRFRSPSPSFSTTPSPSPSDGDKDTEWEEEVELMRCRAPTVSQGWREQLVDGDEDDKSDSAVFGNGVNVDWAGWCFDDDEVLDHLHPARVGLMEGISQSLSFWNIHYLSEQDDGECSQV